MLLWARCIMYNCTAQSFSLSSSSQPFCPESTRLSVVTAPHHHLNVYILNLNPFAFAFQVCLYFCIYRYVNPTPKPHFPSKDVYCQMNCNCPVFSISRSAKNCLLSLKNSYDLADFYRMNVDGDVIKWLLDHNWPWHSLDAVMMTMTRSKCLSTQNNNSLISRGGAVMVTKRRIRDKLANYNKKCS